MSNLKEYVVEKIIDKDTLIKRFNIKICPNNNPECRDCVDFKLYPQTRDNTFKICTCYVCKYNFCFDCSILGDFKEPYYGDAYYERKCFKCKLHETRDGSTIMRPFTKCDLCQVRSEDGNDLVLKNCVGKLHNKLNKYFCKNCTAKDADGSLKIICMLCHNYKK